MTDSDQTVPVPVDLLQRIKAGATVDYDMVKGYSADVSPGGALALLDLVALIPSPPKVGDMLDTAPQIAELPDHSVVIDADGEPWTVVGGEPMYYLDGKREGRGILVRTYGPLTLVHLGKTCD